MEIKGISVMLIIKLFATITTTIIIKSFNVIIALALAFIVIIVWVFIVIIISVTAVEIIVM